MKKRIMGMGRLVKKVDETGTGFAGFLNVGMDKANSYLQSVKGRGEGLGKTLKSRDANFAETVKRKTRR